MSRVWLGLDRRRRRGWSAGTSSTRSSRPGDVILLTSWRDRGDAEAFERSGRLPEGARLRRVRVVRDYGMFDRREAPQYYPDADGRATMDA